MIVRLTCLIAVSYTHLSMLVIDIIKNNQGTWYKIKSDAPLNKEGNQVDIESNAYNVKSSIVFINADDLK